MSMERGLGTSSVNSPPAPAEVRRLFWGVIFGVVLYAILDIVAQLLPPHYSPITQAESDLAVGPFGYIMTVNFVVRGVLSLLFLYALARTVQHEVRGWKPFRSGIVFLGIWGVGALVLAAFPTDVPSLPLSGHGTVHLVVALLAFFGGAVGVFALADHFGDSETLRDAKPWAMALSIVVIVLFIVELGAGFIVPRWAARIGGLTERLFLGSVLVWILLTSYYLARTVPRAPSTGDVTGAPVARERPVRIPRADGADGKALDTGPGP
jgi:hypothetical membrane protein